MYNHVPRLHVHLHGINSPGPLRLCDEFKGQHHHAVSIPGIINTLHDSCDYYSLQTL